MTYSAAIVGSVDSELKSHLLRADFQEDVCYALWHPAKGAHRISALVYEPVLPLNGERKVHGNASTTGDYLERVIDTARKRKSGIAFLHSHPCGTGWQGMSPDDEATELRQAPSVYGATGLPLLGLTLAGNGAWSARFWERSAPRTYAREWCENVRVLGKHGLQITFNAALRPPPGFREELKRTISSWGETAQQQLARLRIGVVGVGSVGSIVAETLARMGVQHIKLIDFDRVERHNLDRLLHATSDDVSHHRLKVDVVGAALSRHATAADPEIERVALAVTEDEGFREALDCDLLFSCVDRPWPRHVLNYIAYAYLIPVIDGGILVRMREGHLRSASWRNHAVYPGRRCLLCLGQYDPDYVNVERRGDLEDPSYIETLPRDHALRRNENVFPFSAHLGTSLVLQALHTALQPVGIADIGEQIYHFVDGSLDTQLGKQCDASCYFDRVIGRGDFEGLPITGIDPAALKQRRLQADLNEKSRSNELQRPVPPDPKQSFPQSNGAKADRSRPQPFNSPTLWNLVVGLGSLMVFVLPLLATYDFYIWLRYGAWPSFDFQDVLRQLDLEMPKAHWVGLQTFLNWVSRQQIGLLVPLVGLFIVGLGSYGQYHATRKRGRISL